MDSQEVGLLLAECLAAAQQATQPTEADRLNYCSCRDLLCAEVASLLQEAMDMKWPFMPEKWQYKQTVSDKDKTNLSDLISKHLSQLLAVLKASIVAHDAGTALALVFLVDRFLYWTDESSRLLTITKLLHRRHPDTPVAPQLVIRQARIYLNSGKLQKAEYILGSLINNSGATGVWVYQSESDRALVQAVSVQVRGMILQKLGLWLEAAELIWASLVGYYALPQPDKKGIGTSLGILANILVSMNDADFHTFRTNPDIDLTLLGGGSHRLLSAAQAAKMAVVYSQYTSLYVLTNVTTQGTCLLAYCFSLECPASQRQTFLLQAREAFTIGLLTKAKDELVTSKQELHTFLKAAHSLTVAHKWLGTPLEVVAQATQACQKALACFYEYSNANSQNKDSLCAEIMHLVAQVKRLLHVEPFLNSDKGSFIPDSYRNSEHSLVKFTLESFDKVMKRFQKYHASLCEINTNSKGTKDEVDGTRLTITALWTTFSKLNTECSTEACLPPKGEEPQLRGSNSPALSPPQQLDLCPTLGSTDDLGSSWDKFSLSSSGSSMPGSFTGSRAIERETNLNQSWPTTEFNDDNSDSRLKSTNKNMHPVVSSHTVPRYAMPATSSSNASHNSEKFELMQAGAGEAALSLSELALRTSSSSLNDSFGSHSSWEKISADSPTNRKPQPNGLSRAGMGQSSKSLSDSDESFFLLETVDSETCQSPCDPTNKNHTSGWDLFNPQPPKSLHVDPNMDKQADSVSVKPVNKDFVERPNPNISPEQCDVTENSTCSLFEILEENPSGHQGSEVTSSEKVNAPHMKNPLCYSCLEHSITNGVVPESQHFLSQQDYQALLAGVCHECLVKRLHSDKTQFKLKTHRAAYSALHLKFSKATGLWTARETCAYIGEPMDKKGNQRMAIWVQFLHQEERLSSYVGKDYLKPRGIQFHLKDVERQMTAQYYVTEFNKSLYNKEVMAQIFFIPSEALLLLNGNEIAGCVTVEPYMPGHFVKLTNNKEKKEISFQATEYGLAFGHFTYLFSNCQEVVVDLQGWVTANGKGLTYLTDPQIHSTKIPKGPSNFGARGLKHFLEDQHGPDCNGICRLLKLPPFVQQQHGLPQKL